MKYPAYPACFTNPTTSAAFARTWDAIVIGSGIGGLATAALLSRFAHKRVLVLERHYTAGGYTHAFQRKGYDGTLGSITSARSGTNLLECERRLI